MLFRRQIRSSRRSRKTRYRQARFDNRARPKGWLPPSLMSRVYNTLTWVKRLCRWSNVTRLSVERVKFDTQLLLNPDINGKQYQQGSLYKFTVKEYLLQKHNYKCVYCDCTNKPLQIEHILAKANRGSDNLTNLTLACNDCNKVKGVRYIEDFLAKDQVRLKKILSTTKVNLTDVAAVNATRNKLLDMLIETNLPVEEGSGSLTKFNRVDQSYPKKHWIDAACNGISGRLVKLNPKMLILKVKAMGYGNRQVTRVNKYGFPITEAKNSKTLISPLGKIKTGDIVEVVCGKGLYIGNYIGRISAINTKTNFFSLNIPKKVYFNLRWITKVLYLHDGYNY
jgi:5-methylcytosine-specific restriction endonuclease McrA